MVSSQRMSRFRRARYNILVALASSILACSTKDEPPRATLGRVADSAHAERQAHALLGPAAKAALDSGNVLFRKKSYSEALAQYRAAAALAPQHSAPLFGIYMVARATDNRAMADSALGAIRLRNGPMPGGPHTFTDSALRQRHEPPRQKPSSN
jgi:hypothetical protein